MIFFIKIKRSKIALVTRPDMKFKMIKNEKAIIFGASYDYHLVQNTSNSFLSPELSPADFTQFETWTFIQKECKESHLQVGYKYPITLT